MMKDAEKSFNRRYFSAIITHILQRPNVVQSSPGSTSIIGNINQSNYQCSQAPEAQAKTFKEDDIFVKPTINCIRSSGTKTPFKQVITVQQDQNRGKKTTPNHNYNSDTNLKAYKINDNTVKSGNYNFKHLAINNCIQKFSSEQLRLLNQQTNENEQYGTNKPKVFYADNGVISHDDIEPKYTDNEYHNQKNLQSNSENSENEHKSSKRI